MLKILLALFRTMRPKQWAKNGFLFAGLIFDRQLTHLNPLLHTLAGFVIFCLLSSVVYILNDLMDLQADRLHPRKRLRPLPSGELPFWVAQVAALVFLVIILPCAYFLSPVFAIFCLLYLLLNLAYTFWFKHMIILDVLILASFYVLRVGAGVSLIVVTQFSPWLYVFTTFLALFLGVGKRRAELVLLEDGANSHRKVLVGYTLPLLDQLLTMVSTMAIMTYSLYTFSASNLPPDHLMMLTIPFVIYGLFRYLYLLQVKQAGGEPEEILFNDRPLQVTLVLFGLAILVIFYYNRLMPS